MSPPLTAWVAKRKAMVFIAAALVVIIGVGTAVYSFDLLGLRSHRARNEQIGANVDVTGKRVPKDLKAVTSNETPPLTDGESLGPVVHITPGGSLPAPMTLRFKLSRAVDPGTTAVIVGSKEQADGEWEYQPATVSADGQYATIERTHLSWFWPSGWDVKKLFNDTKQQVIDAVFGETPKAEQPKCANPDAFKKDTYVVQIDGSKDALLSCTGVEKVDGRDQRVVKVTNNLNYPLLIDYPGLKLPQAPSPDDVKIGFDRVAKIVTKLTSKNQTVLYPSESQTFTVDIAQLGGSARISSDYSGLAQALHRIDIAAAALVFIFTKMGGKGIGTKAKDRWKLADEVLDGTDCANAVYDLNLGSMITKCFTLGKLKDWFDWRGALLSPLVLGGSLYNWIDSEIRSLIDQFTGRAKQTILIGRPDEGIKFYGTWRAHGLSVTFNKGGTGKMSRNVGPCNYTHICTATMDITWRLEGTALVYTIKSYSSKDETGQPAFDIGTDGDVVGKSAKVEFVRTGFLRVTSLAPDYLGNHYLCGKGVSQKDSYECGA